MRQIAQGRVGRVAEQTAQGRVGRVAEQTAQGRAEQVAGRAVQEVVALGVVVLEHGVVAEVYHLIARIHMIVM